MKIGLLDLSGHLGSLYHLELMPYLEVFICLLLRAVSQRATSCRCLQSPYPSGSHQCP